MRMTDALALSHVPRWVIVPRLNEQSVADHSYRVAVIYLEICARLGIRPAALEYCLLHDIDESRTGDIPATAKVAHFKSTPRPIDDYDAMLVKLADLIEAYTWITIWGNGPHADSAAAGLKAKIGKMLVDGAVDHVAARIQDVIDDILNEAGR